jgi:hypothetical protein
MHREGIPRRHADMAIAHADPQVLRIASAISTADDMAALLEYARLALYVQPRVPAILRVIRARMTPPDGRRTNTVDVAAALWRTRLTEREMGHRRGAVIERLTAILVGTRLGSGDVHEEERLVLSDGKASGRYDVLATPPDDVPHPRGAFWEGFECKMGEDLEIWQANSLCWDAERAAQYDDAFLVVVASALGRTSVRGVMQDQLRRPDLVRLVTSETFATLATDAPTVTVTDA